METFNFKQEISAPCFPIFHFYFVSLFCADIIVFKIVFQQNIMHHMHSKGSVKIDRRLLRNSTVKMKQKQIKAREIFLPDCLYVR